MSGNCVPLACKQCEVIKDADSSETLLTRGRLAMPCSTEWKTLQ